jgi:hypothetical protein
MFCSCDAADSTASAMLRAVRLRWSSWGDGGSDWCERWKFWMKLKGKVRTHRPGSCGRPSLVHERDVHRMSRIGLTTNHLGLVQHSRAINQHLSLRNPPSRLPSLFCRRGVLECPQRWHIIASDAPSWNVEYSILEIEAVRVKKVERSLHLVALQSPLPPCCMHM